MKSDLELQQNVLAQLRWEPSINAADIGVDVKSGIVTLKGHVAAYSEKLNTERDAQRVSGVKGLAVEIDVQVFGIHERTDADIARTAENVLDWVCAHGAWRCYRY